MEPPFDPVKRGSLHVIARVTPDKSGDQATHQKNLLGQYRSTPLASHVDTT